MNQSRAFLSRQRGVSLIELMVTMAITLFLVAAAAYVYLGTRETQRAIERNSSNTEAGSFAMQLIGEEIMKAGFYPASTSRPSSADEGYPKLSSYPPIKIAQNNAQTTDWTPPTTTTLGVYLSGLYGCDGAKYLAATGECGPAATSADGIKPDSIVINYFTNDNLGGSNTGDRFDCTGGDIKDDPSNTNRLNSNTNLAPTQPLFVSNRYALSDTKTEIEKQTVDTRSLACNGNGAKVANNNYQPLLAGIEDMQITYGVFAVSKDNGLRTPEQFFTATGMATLGPVTVDNGMFLVSMTPWSRVSAVRVCIMAKSQGGNPRIADKAGASRTYEDCNGVSKTPAAGDTSLRKRFIQVFAVRNQMSQVF